MKISLNQINTVTGDIKGNYAKVLGKTNEALNDGADIIVFPETAFSGYCVGALWDNIDFVLEQEECVRQLMKVVPHNKCVIVGYVSYHGAKPNGFPLLKNSVAVINRNRIQTYHKQLLANADHHEDRKYFKPGKKTKIFDVHLNNIDIKIGTPICEDIWYTDHTRNIAKEMVDMGAEMLISVNQSYFYYGKQENRLNLIEGLSKLKVPIVSVNSVGVGDIVKNIIVYDGGSFIFNPYSGGFIQLKRFEEDTLNVTVISNFNGFSYDYTRFPKSFTNYLKAGENKYEEIINAIIFEQKELFRLVGIPKAQVHISGGLDSAVVMALSILSMGKENCVFITNPTSLNIKSLSVVHQLALNFGVDIYTNELEEIYNLVNKKDTENFGSELNPVGQATMQAVLRTVQGLSACHRFNSGIVATGNHTEIVLGWASFHDIGSVGVHAPIGDLTKHELVILCEHLNQRFKDMGYVEHVIPEDLFNGKIKPAAELPDSMEDPIDYYIQSGLCAEVIRNRKTKNGLITDFQNKRLTADFFPKDVYEHYTLEEFIKEVEFTLAKSKISVFKAAQGAPIVILSPRSRGFSNRETIINKY